MTRLAAGVFGVLVVATFGAFFLAQRLKNSPSVVQQFRRTPLFSPNQDGRKDRAYVNFKLKRTDEVTVAIVDRDGDEVRVLADDRHMPAYTPTRFAWDGRTDDGGRAPDGTYRVRITLHREGRSITIRLVIRLDTTPPRPRVTSVGPFKSPGPEILPLPDGGDAEVHLQAPGRDPVIRLFKTGPGPTRLVREDSSLPDGAKEWRWNGTTEDGRPVSPGTYVATIETRDKAGNRGLSPPLNRRGLPATTYGGKLPGHGGITVRYLGARPPSLPTTAGEEMEINVDARQQPWRWSLRRVGTNNPTPSRRKTSARVRLHAPGKESGVYLMRVNTATHATTVPIPVQSREKHRVLIVLPVMTWQGRNSLDDDGDGLPNLLDRGVGVKLDRVYAGDGLPAGFGTREAPLLAWLDRNHHRYDITTDVALATNRGPRLQGHKGVILPSDVRWLPRSLQQRLRRFVRDGGAVASFGIDSLRRQVTISPRRRLVGPTPAATTDLFGARLHQPERLNPPTNVVLKSDEIDFFAGTSGSFGPFTSIQEADSLGAEPLASAVTEDPPSSLPTLAASRLGKGLVVRYPLPELPAKAASGDPETTALLNRTWTLLSR
jgi:N,N-dimethylformamidase beta subunit-like protein/flagellar hook capping protein FlgD